ncbi:MAG: exodeoxyribonuclease VII large subunit [Aestuariivita sp.]|nr:exodeoxyribonuclease VII large subunit [Aestuariivita sp.]
MTRAYPFGNWGENIPEYSVSEISGAVKRKIEDAFGRVRVRAEIGSVSRARSGHVYFDLKEGHEKLSSVIWARTALGLDAQPEEGMEVFAVGRLSTYSGTSRYQLIVEKIQLAGEGALMVMMEKRRKILESEGLFDTKHKRKLPYLPRVIGVVTSPNGAVIRDIVHRLSDRFPRTVYVWPVVVQGQNCATEVSRAIRGFNGFTAATSIPRPDLLIVARGGGSIEDLWEFNDESVVRAVFDSQIPVISAIGHETDTTLIDFVADKRAPTPTAAAEMAVPERTNVQFKVDEWGVRIARASANAINVRRQRLRDVNRGMPRPAIFLSVERQRVDIVAERLIGALKGHAQRRRLQWMECAGAVRSQVLEHRLRACREHLGTISERLGPTVLRSLRRRQEEVRYQKQTLARLPLYDRVRELTKDLDLLFQRTSHEVSANVTRSSARLDILSGKFESLNHEATLERGYAIVLKCGDVITSCGAIKDGTDLTIQFSDGCVSVVSKG